MPRSAHRHESHRQRTELLLGPHLERPCERRDAHRIAEDVRKKGRDDRAWAGRQSIRSQRVKRSSGQHSVGSIGLRTGPEEEKGREPPEERRVGELEGCEHRWRRVSKGRVVGEVAEGQRTRLQRALHERLLCSPTGEIRLPGMVNVCCVEMSARLRDPVFTKQADAPRPNQRGVTKMSLRALHPPRKEAATTQLRKDNSSVKGACSQVVSALCASRGTR